MKKFGWILLLLAGPLAAQIYNPSLNGTPGVSLYRNPQGQIDAEGPTSCVYGVSPNGDSWGAGGGSATPSTGNWPYYLAQAVGGGNADGQFGQVFPYSSAVLGNSNSADFLIDAVSHWSPGPINNPCIVSVGGLNNVKLGLIAATYLNAYKQQWYGVDAWAATDSNEKLFANVAAQTTLAGVWTSPQYFVSVRSISAAGTNWTVGDIFNLTGNSCSGVTGTIDTVSGGTVVAAHISGFSASATCATGSHTAATTTKNTCVNAGCTGLTLNTYVSPVTEPEEETTGAANTATWNPYLGTNGVVLLYYTMYTSSTGTFTLNINGTPATDTLSGNSTFSCQYPAGVTTPNNLGAGVQLGVARFVTTGSTIPTIAFTPVASGKCGVVALVTLLGTHYRGATAPSITHGLSQPEAQDGFATNRVLYDTYAIAADAQARADGLNVHTVDIAAAMDSGVGSNGLDFLASASTVYPNCASSNSLPLHPDLCGYQHVAGALIAGGMLSGPSGYAVNHLDSPTSTIMCLNCGVNSSASGGQVRNGGATPAVIWSWDNFGNITLTGFAKVTVPYYVGTQAISGCSLTAAHGGKGGGDFLSGTTGTCTVTVTPGFTAANGYTCDAHDLTTTSDTLVQVITGTPTTTASFSGTTVSGDFISWKCSAY